MRAALSRNDAARLVRVSVQRLDSWERGVCAPNAESLARLCTIYGVSADVILGLVRPTGARARAS